MSDVLFHNPVFGTKVEPGDRLYFYRQYSTEPATAYLYPGPFDPASHPIIADGAGRFPPLYLDTSEEAPKVVLKGADGVQKWAVDEYPLEDLSELKNTVYEMEYHVEDLQGRIIFVEDDIGALRETNTEQDEKLQEHQEILDSLGEVSIPEGPVAAGYFTGGSSPAYKQRHGVTSSVNRTGTGTYVITFSTPRSSANYIVIATAGSSSQSFPLECLVKTKRAASFTIETWYITGGGTRGKADREVNFVVYDFGS
ncbi:hypothetical protein [uncultured Microbulbifer sp.]|uniref:hypothetical protein n=1 Tax=uncultured Microbulbifer sp. TaxID=348147 RepID=UPI0026388443|nr:hypothetical protein [uncultured Microbulbifer sp.]